MDIGKAIHTLRKSKRMTQTELACKSRIISSTLSNIERGRTMPTMYTLRNIAEALGVSQAYLMLFCITEHEIPQKRHEEGLVALETLKNIMVEEYKSCGLWTRK